MKKIYFIVLIIFIGIGSIMVPYDELRTYKSKRDFTKTPEPPAKKIKKKSRKKPIFVIQKHDATHLHYDLRLQIGDVLKSWAIPKGPTLNPAEKRLAVETENHPIWYSHFEGIIPEGNYGAGPVLVWDRGTFDNIKKHNNKVIPLYTCYKNGQLEFFLHGKKLQGKFALIKTKKYKQWLFIKIRDEFVNTKGDITKKEPKSVISNKTIEELREKYVSKSDPEKIKIGRYVIDLTNKAKIFFPQSRITKGELVDYYYKMGPIIVSHIKNHPITMHRFPNGIDHEGFYQKDISDYYPSWIKYLSMKKQEDGIVRYAIIDKIATLVYLANQGCVTPHTLLSKFDKPNFPDRLIFDLDPSGSATFAQVQKAAKRLSTLLQQLQLPTFFMLTGSRGAHVIIPLKRKHTFEETRLFAHDVASLLTAQFPEEFTITMHKKDRGNKIFLDWLRNAIGATAVVPYAIRAIEGAPVATPVTYEELMKKNMTSQKFTIKNIDKRIEKVGDIWQNIKKSETTLTKARKMLNKMLETNNIIT